MKKLLCLILALAMVLSMAACGSDPGKSTAAPETTKAAEQTTKADEGVKPDKDYVIRIYSNSNSSERVTWLIQQAEKAGFKISLDTNEVVKGDTGAVQAADEKKDGDLLFGLNETRWGQLIGGTYANLKILDWTPTWADKVGDYKYDGKAYGIVIQNVLMLYRDDDLGTKGKEVSMKHWADIVDCGYTWYRQGKVGGTTNANINSAILYAFVDPSSPAGGISVDGWKTLWKYCANGKFTGDSYGFDPLNKGDVQVSTYYSSSLYGQLDNAASGSEHPLTKDNMHLVKIEDGTYYIAEYIGILDKAGRTEAQTAQVKAFAEWFGGAELQAAWSEEFDTFPCNTEAAAKVYGTSIPEIYTLPNFALSKVADGSTYAEYVAAHSAQWTNIMTNLGFYWADAKDAPAEPAWDTLDWATLTQKKD